MEFLRNVSEISKDKSQDKNILFIQGFNTFNRAIYDSIINRFKNTYNITIYNYNTNKDGKDISVEKSFPSKINENFKMTFFQYHPEQCLESIILKISSLIKKNKSFTHIVGHSLGGYIVTQLLIKDVVEDKKILLLQPLVYPYNNIVKIINYLENNLIYNSTDDIIKYAPSGIIAPKSSLTYSTTLLQDIIDKDFYNLVDVNQIKDSYFNMNKQKFSNIIQLYKEKNVKFMYASDEQLNTLPDEEIQNLKKELCNNFQIICSKHEPFNDTSVYQKSICSTFINDQTKTIQEDFFLKFNLML